MPCQSLCGGGQRCSGFLGVFFFVFAKTDIYYVSTTLASFQQDSSKVERNCECQIIKVDWRYQTVTSIMCRKMLDVL